jgi:hypothetical protein
MDPEIINDDIIETTVEIEEGPKKGLGVLGYAGVAIGGAMLFHYVIAPLGRRIKSKLDERKQRRDDEDDYGV